jgi:hypothetical protein
MGGAKGFRYDENGDVMSDFSPNTKKSWVKSVK